MKRTDIIDFGLVGMSQDYKRSFFYQLDAELKQIHQNGGIVKDFSPRSIYIDDETRVPSFRSVYPSSKLYFDEEDKKQAQLSDVQSLAVLAFCVYLAGESGEFSLENGLLRFDVLANHLDFVKEYVPEEDWEYYQKVFMAFSHEEIPYYSDYMDQKMSQQGRENAHPKVMSRSTAAGRAMASRDNEAAYVNFVLSFALFGVAIMLSIFFFSLVWKNF